MNVSVLSGGSPPNLHPPSLRVNSCPLQKLSAVSPLSHFGDIPLSFFLNRTNCLLKAGIYVLNAGPIIIHNLYLDWKLFIQIISNKYRELYSMHQFVLHLKITSIHLGEKSS